MLSGSSPDKDPPLGGAKIKSGGEQVAEWGETWGCSSGMAEQQALAESEDLAALLRSRHSLVGGVWRGHWDLGESMSDVGQLILGRAQGPSPSPGSSWSPAEHLLLPAGLRAGRLALEHSSALMV